MKTVLSLPVGVLFLSATLAASAAWSADKSIPAVPQAPGKVVEKAAEKVEALKAGDKDKKDLIDINSASEAELRSLKDVGEGRAKRIVKNRPYTRKEDLVQKKVIPEAVYEKIKDQIVVKPSKAAETKPTDAKSAVSAAKEAITTKTK